jgi:hypothetical protein
MEKTTLTQIAQRGTLTYMRPNYEFCTRDGWFYIENNYVVMRKIGGRNWVRYCSVDSVYEFAKGGK